MAQILCRAFGARSDVPYHPGLTAGPMYCRAFGALPIEGSGVLKSCILISRFGLLRKRVEVNTSKLTYCAISEAETKEPLGSLFFQSFVCMQGNLIQQLFIYRKP